MRRLLKAALAAARGTGSAAARGAAAFRGLERAQRRWLQAYRRAAGRKVVLFMAGLATLGASFAAAAEPGTAPAGALTGGALGALLAGTGGPALVQLLKDLVPDRWVPDGISPAGNVALTAGIYAIAALILGEDPLIFLQHGLAVGGASTAMISSSNLSQLASRSRGEMARLRDEYRHMFGNDPGRRSRAELVEDIRLGREYALKRGETPAEHDRRTSKGATGASSAEPVDRAGEPAGDLPAFDRAVEEDD